MSEILNIEQKRAITESRIMKLMTDRVRCHKKAKALAKEKDCLIDELELVSEKADAASLRMRDIVKELDKLHDTLKDLMLKQAENKVAGE